MWKNRYLEQKEKVSRLIREEMCKQEEKITKEIKESRDGGKKCGNI